MLRITSKIAIVAGVFLFLAGCAGSGSNLSQLQGEPVTQAGLPNTEVVQIDWPSQLPHDTTQPWDAQDSSSQAKLSGGGHTVSKITANGVFTAGVERFSEAGTITPLGEALTFSSGNEGHSELTWAMYRVPLTGSQPGAISLDINLKPMSDGGRSDYYLGLSNYSGDRWEWFGPFDNGREVLALEHGNWLSSLGNLFVTVVAYDGANFDLLGIGAYPLSGDSTPPPAPSAVNATSIANGLYVEWFGVAAADLAGYQLYWSTQEFDSPSAPGVNKLDFLVSLENHVLTGLLPGTTYYVRVAAVDIDGNQSALSAATSASPLTGALAAVNLTVDQSSGQLGYVAQLTASGMDSYDWDLNGDGLWEVTGDLTGMQLADTNTIGIVRPRVRGISGQAQAYAAVSLLVTTNIRPVASAQATPTSGVAPLAVSFSGADSTDFDGSIVGGGWDFDGDGTYDVWADADITFVTGTSNIYTAAGVYNAKLRVVDDQGSWDVDTVTVIVDEVATGIILPTASLTADVTSGSAPLLVSFDASASTDLDGSIVEYAWDFDGDNRYDGFTETPLTSFRYTAAGSPEVRMRVEDSDGARATATLTITVNVVGNTAPTAALLATPASGNAPLNVTLDASASNDSDGSITNYEWDFDGDGLYNGYSSSSSIDHTYTTAGVFSARVRVTDDAGAQHTASADVTVSVVGNASPVADLNIVPGTAENGEAVTLDASGSSDSDGTLVNFEWDYDGNGTYDSYGTVATVEHAYPAAGVFTAKVRVTDNAGAQATAVAPVTILNSPPVAVLQGAPLTGFNSIDVAFSAADSYASAGVLTNFEWDFDGDSIFNEAGAEVDNQGSSTPPLQTYTVGPPVLVSVRVTDSESATDVASVTVTVHGWDSPSVIDTVGNVGEYTSQALVDGNPAIAYYDGSNNDLKYVRATDTLGLTWGTPLAVESADNIGGHCSLAMVDGCPAISYYDFTHGNLKYVRAIDAQGNNWGTPLTIDSNGTVGTYTSLVVVDGFPAVSYSDDDSDNLKYVRATDAQGSTWGTPLTLDSSGLVGTYTSLAIVAGHPAISYYDDTFDNLKYVRATDAQGATWGAPVNAETAGSVGTYCSLAVVNGNPAISYYCATFQDLKYVRATDSLGSTWGAPVAVDTTDNIGTYTSLRVVDGQPAISYYNVTHSDLKYARAADVQGSTWSTPVTVDSDGLVGYFSSLAVVNGNPAISYYDGTFDDLKYVRLY